jgi:hypothetical protein
MSTKTDKSIHISFILLCFSVVVYRPATEGATPRACFEVRVSESLIDYYPCVDMLGDYEFSHK